LPCSTKAIARIICQNGFRCKKKKKWRKQRDSRDKKRRLKTISDDRNRCKRSIRYREILSSDEGSKASTVSIYVRTGGEWISYGERKDGTNTAIFLSYLLAQLKQYGVSFVLYNYSI
jgi:hypothetical protein